MHFLRLLRRGCQPRAYGPDRLIRNYRLRKRTYAELLDHATQLTPHNLERLAGLALLPGLTDAEHRHQTTGLSSSELATHDFVALTQNQATLRMTNQDQPATHIHQLARCNLSSEGSLHRLHRTILRTYGNRFAVQALYDLIDVQTGRHDCNFDSSRQGQLAQAFDQLCDTGAGTVHLPVTGYQRSAHALSRRSKWAQILPK
ncbi:hypothetical protein D3C72_1645190 [compost metagenome]